LDNGFDNPTGEAVVEKHKYLGHIRRIGEERLGQGKNVSCSPVGRGMDISLVIQLSRSIDPLREKGQKLPGTASIRLRFALVSQVGPTCLLR